MKVITQHDWQRLDADRAKVMAAAEKRAQATAETPDGVVLTCAATLTPEPVSWLWWGWLALGKFHILAGAPGQGKTTIALAVMALITSGGRWPDGSSCPAGNVLMWSGEDDPADTLLPRLIAMGADPARVFFVTGTRKAGEVCPFDPARDMAHLMAQAEAIGNVRLLVVDPVVSAVAGDSHKNTEVRRELQPLVDLGAALGAAVLGISHFSKGSAGRDPTERVVGSMAFGAVARVVMAAAKVKGEAGEEDRRILVRSKSNIGPDDGGFEYGIDQAELDAFPGVTASRIVWGKPVEGSARELLSDAESVNDDEAVSARDADEALRERLKGVERMDSRTVIDCLKAEGFSEKQIRSARERIGAKVERSGFGAAMRSFWKLPQSCPVVPSHAHVQDGQEWASMGTNGSAEPESEVF